jgi:hypothetical protein
VANCWTWLAFNIEVVMKSSRVSIESSSQLIQTDPDEEDKSDPTVEHSEVDHCPNTDLFVKESKYALEAVTNLFNAKKRQKSSYTLSQLAILDPAPSFDIFSKPFLQRVMYFSKYLEVDMQIMTPENTLRPFFWGPAAVGGGAD